MAIVGLIAAPVYAHYLWLTVDKYNPKPGEEVIINIGWGHKFPQDGQPRAKMVSKMALFLIDPEGKKMPLEIKIKGERGVEPIKVTLKKPGTYLAVLTMKTFVSKTTEGYFYKPKDELKNVLKSKWSETVAKAIINVGSRGTKTFSKLLGYRYEIVPLTNPNSLKEGDLLPVKIILDGKPIRTWAYATYAGFSQSKDTFAWASRTDKKGVAKVKILKKGLWLIKASDQLPYKDFKKADYYYFIATLTFEM